MFLLEIIILIFLCRKNGFLAIQKGLKPTRWKWYTVLAWIAGEMVGLMIGIVIFKIPPDVTKIPPATLLQVSFIGLFSAFGGYLLIRYLLESRPDELEEEDIKQIGVDDLRPPKP